MNSNDYFLWSTWSRKKKKKKKKYIDRRERESIIYLKFENEKKDIRFLVPYSLRAP